MVTNIPVLMIKVKICPDILFCKFNDLSNDNKFEFDLARQILNLAGKCLMIGHYHKFCYLLTDKDRNV